MIKLIKKIWRGDLELAVVYWLYFVLIGTLINVAIQSLPFTAAAFDNLTLLIIIQCTTLIPYYLVVGVGVWRSSVNYEKDNYTKKFATFWATLAKLAIIANIAMILQMVLGMFLVD